MCGTFGWEIMFFCSSVCAVLSQPLSFCEILFVLRRGWWDTGVSPRCCRESRPLSCAANEAKKRGGEAVGG